MLLHGKDMDFLVLKRLIKILILIHSVLAETKSDELRKKAIESKLNYVPIYPR